MTASVMKMRHIVCVLVMALLLSCAVSQENNNETLEKQVGQEDVTETVIPPELDDSYSEISLEEEEESENKVHKTESIAVLLPFSAPVKSFLHTISTAIRAGLLYRLEETKSSLRVHFIDTHNRPIMQAYNEAKALEVGVVFGPLLPKNVRILAQNKADDMEVVALNKIEPAPQSQYWHHFSLSLSEEVEQAARDIARTGHKTALLFYANTTWARKAADNFEHTWREQGGTIGNSELLGSGKKLAKSVSQLVGITNRNVQAYSRYLRQKQLAERAAKRNNKATFVDPIDTMEPDERVAFIRSVTRKYPGDFVYVIADAEQSRQVKPLLSFYLSNDLAIFATSKTHGSNLSAQTKRDLNGIVFSDAPWLTETQYVQPRSSLRTHWPHIHQIYDRFYALGYDVLSVARLLDAHKQEHGSGFFAHGATGMLLMDEQGHLQRKATWHKFFANRIINLQELPRYSPSPSPWTREQTARTPPVRPANTK